MTSATWDKTELKWTIYTQQGDSFRARYFLLNTGFAAKRHIPDWPGLDSFRGTLLHPSYWPHQEPDVRGKRVALVGTGATAVQIAQALAPVAGELVVFQRTPALALPMGQVDYRLDDDDGGDGGGGGGAREQAFPKEAYPDLYRGRTASFGGFDFGFLDRGTFADPPAARRAQYEHLWQQGDFRFWIGTYYDMLFDKAANDEAYAFWRDKTRARIHDPRVRDLLAPVAPPFPFGCKRIPLEQGYYEIFNQSHVSLVDVRATPIQALTAHGVRTSDDKEWGPFDLLICATGYDAFTGGLTDIDIRGAHDDDESTTTTLKEHWKDGPYTYLGMASAGFPNMFFTYGPQAPTALCNGPTCAQAQGDWIAALIQHVDKKEGKQAVEALRGSEAQWRQTVLDVGNATLLPGAKSVSICPTYHLSTSQAHCRQPEGTVLLIYLTVTSGTWGTTYLGNQESLTYTSEVSRLTSRRSTK